MWRVLVFPLLNGVPRLRLTRSQTLRRVKPGGSAIPRGNPRINLSFRTRNDIPPKGSLSKNSVSGLEAMRACSCVSHTSRDQRLLSAITTLILLRSAVVWCPPQQEPVTSGTPDWILSSLAAETGEGSASAAPASDVGLDWLAQATEPGLDAGNGEEAMTCC